MRAIVLALVALAVASVAIASTDPVADTRQIMAGTVTTTKVKNEYLSGARDGTAPFQGALKAYKAVRAAEAPPPAPTPPPVVTPLDLAAEGDSITAGYKNFFQSYCGDRPVTCRSFAVGGSGLAQLEARMPTVIAAKPRWLFVLIGANETPNQAFHDRLMVDVGKYRAAGIKVMLSTLLRQCIARNAGSAAFMVELPAENLRIKAELAAGRVDAVTDLGAAITDPCSTDLVDYVHPSETGYPKLTAVFGRDFDAIRNGTIPVPPPVVTPPEVVSLTGLAPIASNFDINGELAPAWGTGAIPASASPDVVGAFRFICNAGQVLRDDPIVYPGKPGASHLHQFYGNTGANASSTYSSLRASGQSTCMSPLNRSAYWMPAMLDGSGSVVRPDFVSIYYKRRPKSDPKCSLSSGDPQAEGNCVNLPNGLKFIFGYDMLTGKAPTGKLWYNCQGPGSVPGKYATLPEAAAKCPAGAQLGAIIEAPDCWDGKNLDSANHRDHVSYGSYGTWGYLKCPSTHPYVIPTFTLGAWFTSDANARNWRLSSDEMVPNLPRGTTFHADFFMAWDPTVKDMWHANCLNKKLNCSGGDLGNGKQMKQFSGFTWLANPRLVPVPQ